eukprot:SAG31_NODE_326_length_17664_cov_10.038543_23_plen_71_part_00
MRQQLLYRHAGDRKVDLDLPVRFHILNLVSRILRRSRSKFTAVATGTSIRSLSKNSLRRDGSRTVLRSTI